MDNQEQQDQECFQGKDMYYKIGQLQKENADLKAQLKGLTEAYHENLLDQKIMASEVKELEQFNELLREQNIALIKANTNAEKENERLETKIEDIYNDASKIL